VGRKNVRYGNSSRSLFNSIRQDIQVMSRTTVNDEFGRMEKEKWSN